MSWPPWKRKVQPSAPESSTGEPTVRRRAWLRPVIQFIVAGVVAGIILVVGATWLSERAATDEAIADARSTTQILGESVAEPEIRPGLVWLQSSALDRFDQI